MEHDGNKHFARFVDSYNSRSSPTIITDSKSTGLAEYMFEIQEGKIYFGGKWVKIHGVPPG